MMMVARHGCRAKINLSNAYMKPCDPPVRIKSDPRPVVKPGLFLMTLSFAVLFGGANLSNNDKWGSLNKEAAPAASPQPIEIPTDMDDNKLPIIDVRSFPVTILKRSASRSVYLFDDPSAAIPAVGKILLLKENGEPAMGLRVLKHYPQKKQFAAKRVRFYHNRFTLDEATSFEAIEKLTDVGPAPAPTAQDTEALKELEEPDLESESDSPPVLPPSEEGPPGTTPEPGPPTDEPGFEGTEPAGSVVKTSGKTVVPAGDYDPELDVETSPPPVGAIDSDTAKLPPEQQSLEIDDIAFDDLVPIEPNPNAVTGSFGYIRNFDEQGATSFFAAGGARYNLTIMRMAFLRRPLLQDSVSLEGGSFFYKTLFPPANGYNIVSFIGTVRYNIHAGESFSLFFYGGLVQNNVFAAAGADSKIGMSLASILPAGGTGLLFRVGPNWDLRFDFGIDFIGTGIVLGF